jgi:hypothetical protein
MSRIRLLARCLSAVLVLGLAAGLRPGLAHAQDGVIEVIDAPLPEYSFGQSITFRLSAESQAPISDIKLFLDTGGPAPASWPEVAFTRANHVDAVASFDLAINPLPPFAPIRFWWQISNTAGISLTTAPETFNYEDDRFDWRTASVGSVTAHWYVGDEDFGAAAASTAANALPLISRDVRGELPRTIDLYIYGSDADARAALQRVGRAWIDGHADPKLGVVIVAVSPDLRATYNLQREIPHELTHLLIYKATGENYPKVPYWLNEGLAVAHQTQRDSDFPGILAAARDARQFLPLDSLCGPFQAETARLAYAESESVVRYIDAQFGAEGTNRLLVAYAGGASCAAGVQNSLGLSMAELEARWLNDLAPLDNPGQRWASWAPWLLLTALVLLAPLMFMLAAFRRDRSSPAKEQVV